LRGDTFEHEHEYEHDGLGRVTALRYPGGDSNPCLRIESPLSCH
jgi:hypothetical protein